LAPGTQWSQNPTLSFPAARAPRTKGVAKKVVASAALRSTVRRVVITILASVGRFDIARARLLAGPGASPQSR
jgi:hypothetical protein